MYPSGDTNLLSCQDTWWFNFSKLLLEWVMLYCGEKKGGSGKVSCMCLSHVAFHIQNTIDGFPFHATNEADRMKNSNKGMKVMAASMTDVNTVVVQFVCRGVTFFFFAEWDSVCDWILELLQAPLVTLSWWISGPVSPSNKDTEVLCCCWPGS